jgi:hypothetical protein
MNSLLFPLHSGDQFLPIQVIRMPGGALSSSILPRADRTTIPENSLEAERRSGKGAVAAEPYLPTETT